MNRSRALIVSLAAAVAAVAGVLALASTLSLGTQARSTTDQQVAQRTAQLDRYEASLRKALAQKPPRLPALPKAAVSSPASMQAPRVRVVYHRPPPIVVHKSSGSDREGAYEDGHGDEAEGAELDD